MVYLLRFWNPNPYLLPVKEISGLYDLIKLSSDHKNDEYLEIYDTTAAPWDGGLLARELTLASYQLKMKGVLGIEQTPAFVQTHSCTQALRKRLHLFSPMHSITSVLCPSQNPSLAKRSLRSPWASGMQKSTR